MPDNELEIATMLAEVAMRKPGSVEDFRRVFEAGVAEGIRQAREGMDEEFEEPLTYRHPHTGATITSKRFRRYVTDWEEVS